MEQFNYPVWYRHPDC